ncbi:MAG: hypothetical protein ACTSU5_16500 [Promethearchaeota archaeon]
MNKRLLAACIVVPVWLLGAPFFFTRWNVTSVLFGGHLYSNVTLGTVFRADSLAEGFGLWVSLPFGGRMVEAWQSVSTGQDSFFSAFFLAENTFMAIGCWSIAGILSAAIVQRWKYSLALVGLMLLVWIVLGTILALVSVGIVTISLDAVLLAICCAVVGWLLGLALSGVYS